MSADPKRDEPPKHAEKSTTEEPQEEFIADQSIPSHSDEPDPRKRDPELPLESSEPPK